MDIQEVLSFQLSFFKEEELLQEIKEKSQLVDVEAGTPILREGAYVKTMPILLSGLVRVVREEMGKEILLYYIYPLESCIVSAHCGMNQLKSRVKAVAEDQSKALLIPTQYLADWQRKYKSFNDFLLNLYQKRFYDVLDAFNAMAFHSLDERLLSYLESKKEALGSSKIEMTHQDLADELGSARETISRLLKKLEVEEKVRLHRGWIETM